MGAIPIAATKQNALVAKLVDAPDLESGVFMACEFESHQEHQIKCRSDTKQRKDDYEILPRRRW